MPLFAFFVVAPISIYAESSVQELVNYDFELENYDTGPDTFSIFQHSAGTVLLSDEAQLSGYRSLRIEDVAGDRNFPELQGYYPEVDRGAVQFSFAFMTIYPEQIFNIALAGKAHYRLVKDGISFWLSNEDGVLHHHPDGRKQKLLTLIAYQWYLVNLEMNIDSGRYSLKIFDEFDNELAAKTNQIVSSSSKYSSINQFSFIGDLDDEYSALYYVDDIRLTSSQSHELQPFKAPGRRKFFVDLWVDYNQSLRQKIRCLPAFDLREFGFTYNDITDIEANASEQFKGILNPETQPLDLSSKIPTKVSPPLKPDYPLLTQMQHWHEACDLLDSKLGKKALEKFKLAYEGNPDALSYQFGLVIGYFAAGQEAEAYSLLYEFQGGDERWNLVLAMFALNKLKFDDAQEQLSDIGPFVAEQLRSVKEDVEFIVANEEFSTEALKRKYPNNWKVYIEKATAADQYYYALLALGEYEYALFYADELEKLFLHSTISKMKWVERQGDAAFFAKDYTLAEQRYRSIKDSISAMSKLADIYLIRGEYEKEKMQRESLFGTLREM